MNDPQRTSYIWNMMKKIEINSVQMISSYLLKVINWLLSPGLCTAGMRFLSGPFPPRGVGLLVRLALLSSQSPKAQCVNTEMGPLGAFRLQSMEHGKDDTRVLPYSWGLPPSLIPSCLQREIVPGTPWLRNQADDGHFCDRMPHFGQFWKLDDIIDCKPRPASCPETQQDAGLPSLHCHTAK